MPDVTCEKNGGIRQTLSLHEISQVSPKMLENCAKPVSQKLPQPSMVFYMLYDVNSHQGAHSGQHPWKGWEGIIHLFLWGIQNCIFSGLLTDQRFLNLASNLDNEANRYYDVHLKSTVMKTRKWTKIVRSNISLKLVTVNCDLCDSSKLSGGNLFDP